ncbi:15173_t:CDS:1, partial [Gigaspora margarita]
VEFIKPVIAKCKEKLDHIATIIALADPTTVDMILALRKQLLI